MNTFYGFDLGDAESAVARLKKGAKEEPEILPVRGAKSFVSAYALTRSGETVIGENACYTPKAVERKIRFKSRFLTDPVSRDDIRRFAAGVLADLVQEGNLAKTDDDCSFHIGCPAGWDKAVREQYREIFEAVGYPPIRIVTESRAALLSACHSRHLQVGYDILAKPMLVVDMGSSTTDFAYILRGKEVELQTAGEVFLGGGIMDELLLEEAITSSMHAKKIREIFKKSEPWCSYCEFTARRLKEKYFSDETYWQTHPCEQSVMITYSLPVRLSIRMNPETANHLLYGKSARLNGRCFADVFCDSLKDVQRRINGEPPQLLFLTGGVSRLPAVRKWCQEIFPDAVIIAGSEPEFSVAKGLAWSGAVDEELREFKAEINTLKESDAVEQIVEDHITDLYSEAVNTLVEPILKNAAIPVFLRWRKGEIRKLKDIDGEMQKAISDYLHSDDAKGLLIKPIAKWLKPVAAKIEECTIPICIRHNVPYKALSLTSYLSCSEIEISVDAKDVFAMDEVTWMINAIISVLVGLLCGGGGVALISNGLPGIVTGASISLLVLFLGKNKMQEALLSADIPTAMRHMIPKSFFESRIEQIRDEVQQNFYQNLETKQSSEITQRMIDDISSQIELCLTKMAEVVEIPLG